MGSCGVWGITRSAANCLLAVVLVGCGNSGSGSGKEFSGVYVPQGRGIYNRFEFQPGHKVAVTFATLPKVLDYVVRPDGRIQIFGTKVQTLRELDDGCLVLRGPGRDGVEVDVPDFGRYCRH